jgi:hypothetical protein
MPTNTPSRPRAKRLAWLGHRRRSSPVRVRGGAGTASKPTGHLGVAREHRGPACEEPPAHAKEEPRVRAAHFVHAFELHQLPRFVRCNVLSTRSHFARRHGRPPKPVHGARMSLGAQAWPARAATAAFGRRTAGADRGSERWNSRWCASAVRFVAALNKARHAHCPFAVAERACICAVERRWVPQHGFVSMFPIETSRTCRPQGPRAPTEWHQ